MVHTNSEIINNAYARFYEKYGYIPRFFNAYNCAEIKDVAPTITTRCGLATSSGCVLIAEPIDNKQA
jgi:hypothetical protein